MGALNESGVSELCAAAESVVSELCAAVESARDRPGGMPRPFRGRALVHPASFKFALGISGHVPARRRCPPAPRLHRVPPPPVASPHPAHPPRPRPRPSTHPALDPGRAPRPAPHPGRAPAPPWTPAEHPPRPGPRPSTHPAPHSGRAPAPPCTTAEHANGANGSAPAAKTGWSSMPLAPLARWVGAWPPRQSDGERPEAD
jgi:hypothetical protein